LYYLIIQEGIYAKGYMLKQKDFFDLEGKSLKDLFNDTEFVWEGLKNIKEYIKEIIYNGEVLGSGFSIENGGKTVVKDGIILKGASVIFAGVSLMDDEIYIGRNTIIEPGALIKGPTIIGDNNEIRQGAYIRGNVIIGDDCVVGHNTEMKNAVMLGGSKAGHFAYIGDSILGKVNLGAGTKLANLKMVDSNITLTINGKKYQTELRKFGAIFADGVETGCNSVAMPGSLLSRNVLLYPNTTARGYYPPGSIIKLRRITETRKRR